MKILKKINHYIEMRRLRKKFDYVIGKMKEHEHDADPTKWKAWARLNMMYLRLMDRELEEYKQQIES